ncbi:MAG: hypothetical protein AAFW98_16345 [Pseudomonadota bacterium]
MTVQRVMTAGAAALVLAAAGAAPAAAAGYLKIPDIPGESKASDGVETEDIGFRARDGAEWTTRDKERPAYIKIVMKRAQAGSSATDSKHTDWIPVETVRQTPTRAPRDAATGLATGKRQHKPLRAGKTSVLPPKGMTGAGSVRLPAALPGCRVGTRYPHVLVGDEGGDEVRLKRVRVTECAAETVTIVYEVIQRSV